MKVSDQTETIGSVGALCDSFSKSAKRYLRGIVLLCSPNRQRIIRRRVFKSAKNYVRAIWSNTIAQYSRATKYYNLNNSC